MLLFVFKNFNIISINLTLIDGAFCILLSAAGNKILIHVHFSER